MTTKVAFETTTKITTRLLKYLEPVGLLLFLTAVIWSFMGYEVPTPLLVANVVLILGFFTIHTFSQGLAFYVLRRLLQTVFVMWVIASLTFLLLRILPGGPFDSEKALPPAVKANIERIYKLNDPLPTQYATYMGGLLKGDLGVSYKYIGRNVSEIVAESFPASFQLGIFSLILAFAIGIPAGIFAASKHNTWYDSVTMMFAISSVSLPSFLVAAILIVVFSFKLDWLPVALWDGPTYYILPVVVLGLRPAAIIARLTRATVLDVIRSDYIRTARAKGLAERNVLYKHVLKNSLIPVLTFAGPLAAGILSGSFVIEHIFNIPGIGKHFIESVSNRDYPLVIALTLLFSFLLVIANLIVDLLYTYFDPRIKLS
jgi:oligopeptide transport system permease protein